MNFGVIGSKKFSQLLAKAGLGPSIGDIRHSRLSEEQFQALNGNSWVLYDDRNVEGTDLASLTGMTVLDDARGLVLRGKNHGRNDGFEDETERALGSNQMDQMQKIEGGPLDRVWALSGSAGALRSTVSGTSARATTGSNSERQFSFDSSFSPNARTSATNAGETRMRNIAVNIFIKINW
jgi:hypothetical protein